MEREINGIINPWLAGECCGHPTFYCSTEDRIARLKDFSAEELRRAIDWPDTQKSVRKAAEKRLRRLEAAC